MAHLYVTWLLPCMKWRISYINMYESCHTISNLWHDLIHIYSEEKYVQKISYIWHNTFHLYDTTHFVWNMTHSYATRRIHIRYDWFRMRNNFFHFSLKWKKSYFLTEVISEERFLSFQVEMKEIISHTKWIMSHVSASCRIWMSNLLYEMSRIIYVKCIMSSIRNLLNIFFFRIYVD